MDTTMADMTATHPPTALEILHSTVDRLTATDPADSAGAVRIIYEALALTATANSLIDKALMEFEFEVYWRVKTSSSARESST